MINFYLGWCAVGKTTVALHDVLEHQNQTKKPVYYTNVNGGFFHHNFNNWHDVLLPLGIDDLPADSIYLCDGYRHFFQKDLSLLKQYRNKNIDVYLTEYPDLHNEKLSDLGKIIALDESHHDEVMKLRQLLIDVGIKFHHDNNTIS